MPKDGQVPNEAPLGFMTKISEAAYVYRPSTAQVASSTSSQSTSQPKLVFLLGWFAAQDAHLAGYVKWYRSEFPAASIILVKGRFAAIAHVALRAGPNLVYQDVAGAVPLMCSILASSAQRSPASSPDLLVHAFSNGGVCLLTCLYEAYAVAAASSSSPQNTRSAPNPAVLPPHITIIDSAPTLAFSYGRIVATVLSGVPRGSLAQTVALPFAHLLSMLWLARIRLTWYPDDYQAWSKAQNSRSRKPGELARVYLYGDGDVITDTQDIEAHAAEAERKGFNVDKVLFAGSPHVMHARREGERYWRAVREAWADGTKRRLEKL